MALSGNQKEAIKLIFEGKLTNKQIAKKLDITERTVYNWKKDEEFMKAQDEFEELQDKIDRRSIRGLVPEAIKTMKELLCAEAETVRYNAAKDILDRMGFKPVEKSEVDLIADIDVGKRSELFERYLKDDG